MKGIIRAPSVHRKRVPSVIRRDDPSFSTSFKVDAHDTTLGIADDAENTYTTLMYEERPRVEILKLAAGLKFQKWEQLASSILKQGNWARLGHLAKSLHVLPEDIADIFNNLEKKSKIAIKAEMRLQYYQDFTRSALGATTLHFREVELLIRRRNPEIQIGHNDLHTLMTSKLEHPIASSKVNSENNEYFDFEHFASLIYDLLHYHEESGRVQPTGWSIAELLRQLPLEPESGHKQSWDLLCLVLLLYCSFSVPYSIAFDDSVQEAGYYGLTPIQAFELFVDCVFMFDLVLNFVTGWDNQGYIIRDFRVIASRYVRTWFFPDLAGSFPFDKVISTVLSNSSDTTSSVASTNLLRSLKLVRMLKLIRAVKFINKLNKLKQLEGFEAFGSAISLGSAIFFLIFVSHVLGCCFTLLSQYETSSNWLLNYRSYLLCCAAAVSTTLHSRVISPRLQQPLYLPFFCMSLKSISSLAHCPPFPRFSLPSSFPGPSSFPRNLPLLVTMKW